MENLEPISCPLWVNGDKRFSSRHYHAWDRPCGICGRKVVVSSSVKRKLDSAIGTVIVCEQCAPARSEFLDSLRSAESKTLPACSTCDELKAQEESAAAELARIKGLDGTEEALQRWGHIFTARWQHKFKAHNDEARGR